MILLHIRVSFVPAKCNWSIIGAGSSCRTYVSAQRDVRKLVDLGILRADESETYGKSFIAGEIVRTTNLNQ
jgi:hypothetical protein